jgi:hypothetical protein
VIGIALRGLAGSVAMPTPQRSTARGAAARRASGAGLEELLAAAAAPLPAKQPPGQGRRPSLTSDAAGVGSSAAQLVAAAGGPAALSRRVFPSTAVAAGASGCAGWRGLLRRCLASF